ncbi:MAG: hypothetical protein PWP04_1069 [Candidatus Atribacteria bacterium]|nr:hypothetical protein [Candidatus Atribacteria bacterium]
MTHRELLVRTHSKEECLNITNMVAEAVSQLGKDEGICLIQVPHTTCGITLNEDADPDVIKDILRSLKNLVPDRGNYDHLEGNSPAHIKTSLVGSSVGVILEGGHLLLGRWQGVFLCEFDGPRQRRVWLKII